MNASDLIEIYKQSGDGIFFENVRDFIGREEKSSSSEINNEIFKTAKNEPSRMLERNNGITFKASSLTKSDEGLITLENAGIINGCQTTVCISEAQPQSDCFVVFKVVVTDEEEDSLTIAKTANTQNKIEKINLELSEFVRPQLLKIALSEIGLKIDDNSNAPIPSLASSIAIKNVIKTDLRGLFIALFSSPPRNVFRSDYSAIRFDEVRTHFRGLTEKKRLITLLARLILVCDEVIQDMKENNESSQSLATDKVFKLYKRFFEEGKNYKSYIIVVAVCCHLGIQDENSYKKKDIGELVNDMSKIIDNELASFRETIRYTFKAIAISSINRSSSKDKPLDDEIAQQLSKFMSDTSLDVFFATYGTLLI